MCGIEREAKKIYDTGKEEGIWHLDLKNGDGSCGQGEPKNPPDATLTMDSNNFADMFAGNIKIFYLYCIFKI